MRVAVIGTGYVGLVTGVCLSEVGHEVVCVDREEGKVAAVNAGTPTIHEAGLEALLQKRLRSGFRATTDLTGAVQGSDLSLIAVGTPFDGVRIDLTAVAEASRAIGTALRESDRYHVVAVKSTVVPGTTETVVRQEVEAGSGRSAGSGFGLGMNPEFLTEGQAVQDFMHPDRIVIGGLDERSCETLARLHAPFTGVPLLRTNLRTAEMIKYASNAMLATAISFSNELAALCAALGGVDIAEVMPGIHLSGYLSPRLDDGRRVRAPLAAFFEAGCGFGGSCLPKDVKALVAHGVQAGVPMPLLEAVLQTNQAQAGEMLGLIRRHYPELAGLRVTVLGLAFKPDTDDMRESPGLRIVDLLLDAGARVTGYDPAARPDLAGTYSARGLALAEDLSGAVAEAEVIVIATRWNQFQTLPDLLKGRDPQPLVVDGRRLLSPDSVARYEGIGRRIPG